MFILQIEAKEYTDINDNDGYHKYLNLLQNKNFENKKKNLVRFSDIYSLGTSCILKSFVLLDQNKNKNIDPKILGDIKQKLYNIGLNYLYNYFTFKKNLIGGSTQVLSYPQNIYKNYTTKFKNPLNVSLLEQLYSYSQIKLGRSFNMNQQDYNIANNFKATMDITYISKLFEAIENNDAKSALALSNINIINTINKRPDTIELQKITK
jgi:hypothetical protein